MLLSIAKVLVIFSTPLKNKHYSKFGYAPRKREIFGFTVSGICFINLWMEMEKAI